MNKATLLISILILLFNSSNNLAQDKNPLDSSIKIKKILPKDCVFSGDFIQIKTIKSLPEPLISEGILFFSCQHGLIWKSIKPFPESLIYTSEKLHYRSVENEQVIPLDGQHHYYLAQFLLNLLSANTDSLNEQFSIKAVTLPENKARIVLLPKSQFIQKGLESITIEKIANNDTREESLSVSISDPKGKKTTLEIRNLIPHSKEGKVKIDSDCRIAIKNDSGEKDVCNILSDPQRYQIIESSH